MLNEGSTAKNKLQQLLKRRHQFENCPYGKSSLTTQYNNASDYSINWNQLSISSKSYALNTSKIYKKAFLCHSQARQFTSKRQDIPAAKQQNKQKLLNATKSVDNLVSYPHKMNNKWFYPDFQEASKYKKRLSIKQLEENTNLMNTTSPLQQWKKVEKKYRRLQTQQNRLNMTCDHPQTQASPRPFSKFLEHVINTQNEKNIEICKESFELKLLLKRFKKGADPSPTNKKETEIEKKIVLKKSKSPGVSHQRKTQKGQQKGHMQKDKHAFVTEEQQHWSQQGDKLSKETKKKKSDKAQKQNEQPVILIHKQPLERYIQSFFTPLHQSAKKTSIMDKSNIQVAKRALIRIKTKKFTMRSIERLQKLSRNLFKEKSQRDLYQIDHQQVTNQMDKEKHQLKDHSKRKGKGMHKNKENQQASKKHDKSKDIECEIVPDASKGKEQSLVVRFPGHFKSHNQHQSLPSNLIRQPQLQAQPCDNFSGKLGQLEQKMKKQMDSEGTKTPSLRKISMSSSEVLFDESLTPNKEVQNNNQQGFFNAW